MLRTFLILGLIIVVGGALLGVVLGVAGLVLLMMLRLVIIGAIAYLAIRIISPRTAARLRAKIEELSTPERKL